MYIVNKKKMCGHILDYVNGRNSIIQEIRNIIL